MVVGGGISSLEVETCRCRVRCRTWVWGGSTKTRRTVHMLAKNTSSEG